MIPAPGKSLSDLARKLATLIPDLGSAYDMANVGMISMLLEALSGELDGAVAGRLEDVEDLQALFAAATHAPDADTRAHFAKTRPASLRLQDIETWHALGLELLITLHIWAEREDPGLNLQIWDYLRRHTERFKLPD